MNIMFDSSDYFVRVQDKGAHRKITIWNNKGDKLFSDFLGPDPAAQFWETIASLADEQVVTDLKTHISA